MSFQKEFYCTQARTLIKHLSKRNMIGTYFATKEEATAYILSMLPDESTISWGGSMSLIESGVIDALYRNNTYTLYDRAKCPPEHQDELIRQSYFSDFYLMSSNAITLDGQLVNIDRLGNRVSAMIYGPKKVIILVSMNKVCTTVEEAINRVRNVASPQNTLRLKQSTPCAATGVCGNCLSPDCICMHTVITRNNYIPERIHVVLVGEALGF